MRYSSIVGEGDGERVSGGVQNFLFNAPGSEQHNRWQRCANTAINPVVFWWNVGAHSVLDVYHDWTSYWMSSLLSRNKYFLGRVIWECAHLIGCVSSWMLLGEA